MTGHTNHPKNDSPENSEPLPPEPCVHPCTPPYKGLDSYNIEDHENFFGRQEIVDQMIECLADHPLLTLTGPAGSGKTSLVQAGFLPALKEYLNYPMGSKLNGSWLFLTLNVQKRPFHDLAQILYKKRRSKSYFKREALREESDATIMDALQRYRRARKAGHLLLVIEQFDNLFQEPKDRRKLQRLQKERTRFIDCLRYIKEDISPIRIILMARDSAHTKHIHQISHRRARFHLHFLSPTAQSQVITQPAERGGWAITKELHQAILNDFKDNPQMSPLLSYALDKTWQRRRGRTMTRSSYNEVGRLTGLVTDLAETTYQSYSPYDQERIKYIFQRLAQPDENDRYIGRIARLEEFIISPQESIFYRKILAHLVNKRLIASQNETFQITHDGLLNNWTTIRNWLDQDRASLIIRHRLSDAISHWADRKKRDQYLLDGNDLLEILAWQKDRKPTLTDLEKKFLASCRRERTEDIEESWDPERENDDRRFFDKPTM